MGWRAAEQQQRAAAAAAVYFDINSCLFGLRHIVAFVRFLNLNFTVHEVSPDTFEVKYYDMNTPLSEKQSWFIYGDTSKWNGFVNNDTLTFIRNRIINLNSYDIVLKLINNPESDLPIFSGFYLVTKELSGDILNIDTVHAGIVKIQDFNINSIVSGRIFTDQGNFIFWHDFGN